jgi:hypothetical protein
MDDLVRRPAHAFVSNYTKISLRQRLALEGPALFVFQNGAGLDFDTRCPAPAPAAASRK